MRNINHIINLDVSRKFMWTTIREKIKTADSVFTRNMRSFNLNFNFSIK